MKQIALITGAARNIGKGIARTLLAQGYTCILVDQDGPELKRTLKELETEGECYDYVADIADPAALERLLAWTKDRGMSVTALINNAAYGSPLGAAALTVAEIDRSLEVNLKGPFYLTSLMVQDWIRGGTKGTVIFISSTHAKIIRTHPLYSASKAAVEMFVKEAALELAGKHIRVNAVAPGVVIDTPKLNPQPVIPMGFDQQPSDIGEAVVFLLSDKARFITGITLTVDGGFRLTHTHYWKNRGQL